MYTVSQAASTLGLKENTLRYWINRNQADYEEGIYDFLLTDLMPKLKVYKKVVGKVKARHYEQSIILDLDEFKEAFDKYLSFIENSKKAKRHGIYWWSQSAIECYKNSMNCANCFNNRICSQIALKKTMQEPPMKTFVKKLLEKNGEPPTF